jgi:hypothetical protein
MTDADPVQAWKDGKLKLSYSEKRFMQLNTICNLLGKESHRTAYNYLATLFFTFKILGIDFVALEKTEQIERELQKLPKEMLAGLQ